MSNADEAARLMVEGHDQETSYWREIRKVAGLTDFQIASPVKSSLDNTAPIAVVSASAAATREWARAQIRSKDICATIEE